MAGKYVIRPLTSARWKDFEKLFGQRGACGGCWCMWWRLKRSEFEKKKGAGNKRAMKRLVNSGEIPGLLVYSKGDPVGWCSVGPRESFGLLERSRVLCRVDDKPVWSIVCFFIRKDYRKKGVMSELILAAAKHAKKHKAKIIEAYPIDPGKKQKYPATFAYTGIVSAFRRAGFKEVARRSEKRPIMRLTL